jgi:hypothetical protein
MSTSGAPDPPALQASAPTADLLSDDDSWVGGIGAAAAAEEEGSAAVAREWQFVDIPLDGKPLAQLEEAAPGNWPHIPELALLSRWLPVLVCARVAVAPLNTLRPLWPPHVDAWHARVHAGGFELPPGLPDALRKGAPEGAPGARLSAQAERDFQQRGGRIIEPELSQVELQEAAEAGKKVWSVGLCRGDFVVPVCHQVNAGDDRACRRPLGER